MDRTTQRKQAATDFAKEYKFHAAQSYMEAFLIGAQWADNNQWISVDDELPEGDCWVFTCSNDEGTPACVGMAKYDHKNDCWIDDEDEPPMNVDFWMYVPDFNKKKKN